MPITGNTRWAVVMCSFKDIPGGFNRDSTYLTALFNQTGAGKGGLYDYWHDMSYGNISLADSDVFGPSTMQYSFGKDWGMYREAYVTEAIRILVKEQKVDVSPYYGFVAVVNARVDSSSGAVDLAGVRSAAGVDLRPGTWGIVVTTSETMDQPGWRWCSQCNGLWNGAGKGRGKCPHPADATGGHTNAGSANYIVLHDLSTFSGQGGWYWCKNCQGLFYGGASTRGGWCPNGGSHDGSASYRYQMALNLSNFPGSGSYGGQNAWRWCSACSVLWYGGFVKDTGNPNDPGLGSCPARSGKGHVLDLDASRKPKGDYTLPFVQSEIGDLNYTAHEMGHGYTLNHANLETPLALPAGPLFGVEYGDNYCLMGATPTYQGAIFPRSGSGLSGTNRDRLGWIAADRLWEWDKAVPADPMAGVDVLLAGLDTPAAVLRSHPAYLLAKVSLPERTLTVEFRKKRTPGDPSGTPSWDSALPRDGIIIRELRTWYSFGQQHWKSCSKCHGLAYSPLAGTCPAGGNHDFSASGDYSVVHDVSVPVSNYCDDNWRWCSQCQCLTYAPVNAPPGPCRFGTQHNHTGSAAYALLYGVLPGQQTQEGTQHEWRVCEKCNTLFDASSGPSGVCFADGGTHALAFSPDYTLIHSEDSRHSFLLADSGTEDWQPGREFIHDAGNVRIKVDEFRTDAPLARITVAQLRKEEPHWYWCSKCYSLVYWHNPGDTTLLRKCPAGRQHSLTSSWEYRLTAKTSAVTGQQQWYTCSKCFALVYGGYPDLGVCLETPGRAHAITGATEYQVDIESTGIAGQRSWRWCGKCEELWWSGLVRNPADPNDAGYAHCPAGARHTFARSGAYLLRHGRIWP